MQRGVWCARTEMHEESAEKTKANRDLRIIVICTALGVGLPLVALLVTHLRFGS
jgi:hypothetical protein